MLVSYQRDAVPYQRDSAQLVGKIPYSRSSGRAPARRNLRQNEKSPIAQLAGVAPKKVKIGSTQRYVCGGDQALPQFKFTTVARPEGIFGLFGRMRLSPNQRPTATSSGAIP